MRPALSQSRRKPVLIESGCNGRAPSGVDEKAKPLSSNSNRQASAHSLARSSWRANAVIVSLSVAMWRAVCVPAATKSDQLPAKQPVLGRLRTARCAIASREPDELAVAIDAICPNGDRVTRSPTWADRFERATSNRLQV